MCEICLLAAFLAGLIKLCACKKSTKKNCHCI